MMLYKLLSSVDRSRFNLAVISLMGKGSLGKRLEELDIPVYILEMDQGRLTPFSMWQLLKFIRLYKPDIVQGWMYHGNTAASFCKLCCYIRIPVVWNIRHSMYAFKHEKKSTSAIIRLGIILSKFTEYIIYNSEISAAQHQKLGYSDKKTIIIPNGFDCDNFKPSYMERNTFRNTLPIEKNDVIIGLVARYHPMKDHSNFLKAAGLLAEKYNNVHFVLVGTGLDGKNTVVRALVEKNKLGGKISLLGERNDVSAITAGLDIATSSSYSEAFPNVVGESMACGIPCVVTDVGDSSWIVGDTGKVVPPRDSEALFKAWEYLITIGKKERRRLGTAARMRVRTNFSLPEVTQRYQSLYERIFSHTHRNNM